MADPGRQGLIRNAVLIAGPTASGKSAMAMSLARREGGVIVNADSMQVYGGLSVLTARPTDADMMAAPHRLYGHVPPSEAYSVGAWLRDVERLLAEEDHSQGSFIFVGGTGLYFLALTEGLAAIPPVPAEIRARWRARSDDEGASHLYEQLRRIDPAAAAVLHPQDGQRLVRALEVMEATGRSLLEWQAGSSRPIIEPSTARKFVIEPERGELVRRIDARFDSMMSAGALDEARAIGAMRLDPGLPAMKAIGVTPLLKLLSGEIPPAQAVADAKTASRQYAKRQATWFRHKLGDGWARLPEATLDAT